MRDLDFLKLTSKLPIGGPAKLILELAAMAVIGVIAEEIKDELKPENDIAREFDRLNIKEDK